MKYLASLMLSSFLCFNSHADIHACNEMVLQANSNVKITLSDVMLRRIHEEYLSLSWPRIVDQIYIQSSQGQVVSSSTLDGMDRSITHQVASLKESLSPDFGSGVKINPEAVINDLDRCLPQEVKDRCIESIQSFNLNIREFAKNDSLLLSTMSSLVTLIETLNSEVQQSNSSGQVYSTERAYEFKNNLNGTIEQSTNLKTSLGMNAGAIGNLRNQLSNCFYND